MSEPMPDDVFDRLTTLERAQFLYASAQRRHSEALDRQQDDLQRHEGMHQEHVTRMARLETLLERQQELQTQCTQMQERMLGLTEENRTRIAQNEAMLGTVQRTLDAVLEMLRGRNGH